jgi:hypothetical protein
MAMFGAFLAQAELFAFFKVLEDQIVLFFAVALHRLQSFHFILLFGFGVFPGKAMPDTFYTNLTKNGSTL